MLKEAGNIIVLILRGIARVLTLLIIFFFVLSIIKYPPNPAEMTAKEIILFAGLLAIVTGFVIAWIWEGLGGLIIITGYIFFWIINYIFTGEFWLGEYFLIFPITGLLFIFCWWRTKRISEMYEEEE